MLHIRALSPMDDLYGLGALEAASGAIAAHNAAAKWNRALLGNAARPSGALMFEAKDAGALSPEQFERLRGEMEAGFTGAGRAGRPLLLEGGLKWQPLSMTPSDMDFAGGQAAAARDIALALGVPPMLLGPAGGQYLCELCGSQPGAVAADGAAAGRADLRGAVRAGCRFWWPGARGGGRYRQAWPALSDDRARRCGSAGLRGGLS